MSGCLHQFKERVRKISAFFNFCQLPLFSCSNALFRFQCPESAWDKIFDVNVKSTFLLTKETVPYLKKNKEGRIIFLSSISGVQPKVSTTFKKSL